MTRACTAGQTSLVRTARLTPEEWATVDAFHRLWYERSVVGCPQWLTWLVMKTPMDLWAYQEVLAYTRPDWLIETGTAWGGSALFFATIMDLLGHGRVLTIDHITDVPALYRWALDDGMPLPGTERPRHPRITYVCGDVLAPETLAVVRDVVQGRCMVSLDSSHEDWFVQQELAAYAPLVSPGCYLVVEDTNVGGHPVHSAPWNGPYDVALQFLGTHREFVLDFYMNERFLMSYNTWIVRREGTHADGDPVDGPHTGGGDADQGPPLSG